MTRFLLILFLAFYSALPAAKAEPALDMRHFESLPVQYEGRIKPMDTFARQMLVLLAGQDRINGQSASQWIAKTLFDPARSIEEPVFYITRPTLLDLPVRKSRLYSFAEISPFLEKNASQFEALVAVDEEEWSEDQKEVMHVYQAALAYTQLLRSFSYFLPLALDIPPDLAALWGIESEESLTLDRLARHIPHLEKTIRELIRTKGEDPSHYTDEERRIVTLGMNLSIMRDAGSQNVLLRILPSVWEQAKGEWFSPWSITQMGQGSPKAAEYLSLWEKMARAYIAQESELWLLATKETRAYSSKFSSSAKLSKERFYNTAHPLHIALFLYFFAFLFLLMRAVQDLKLWTGLTFAALGLGLLSHCTAIVLRVLILERAPVGTLYESILFVSAVCVLCGIFLEYKKRDGHGFLLASITGSLLLLVALGFADTDTMQVLVAVLNTNFWLTTHVLCITIGYGFCLVTALYAHFWLYRYGTGRDTNSLDPGLKILILASLLFTAVGTILGGIWADQSWGRFWGWDPKENGALLIVLWIVWLLHARLCGQLDAITANTGYAALSIIVALAWFGVNLLNVGLHSYGFISGVAGGLATFIALESLVIGFLWYKAHLNKRLAA